MSRFGSMKKTNQVDEPPMEMIQSLDVADGSGTVELAEVAASSTSLPNAIKGRGTGRAVSAEVPLAGDVIDNILDQFSGLEAMPPAVPVVHAPPVAETTGIEGTLIGQPLEPDVDAMLASDAAAAGAGKATSDSNPEVPPQDPAAKAETSAAAGGQSALDYLRAQNLGNSHEILHSLLKSGLDTKLAVSYANEVVNHFNEFTRDGLEQIDKVDMIKEEKRLQENEAEAARSGKGGGLISGLLSKVLPFANPNNRAQIEEIGNRRRKLIDEHSGFADAMTNRIRLKLEGLFAESMANVNNSANALARSVVAYNLRVMESSADFKKAVESEAQASLRTVEEVLKDIGKGGGSEELRNLMDDAIVLSATDSEVAKAKKVIAERELVFAENSRTAAKRLETMTLNDPSIDPKAAGESLSQAYEAIQDRMPSPLDTAEEKRKFTERMQEIAESMQNAIRALMDALASRFGAKP